jgi:hypothetical protein
MDKLKSYGVAKQELLSGVKHRVTVTSIIALKARTNPPVGVSGAGTGSSPLGPYLTVLRVP